MDLLLEVPEWFHLPVADWVSAMLQWVVTRWGFLFDAIAGVLRWVLLNSEKLLLRAPWTAVVAVLGLAAWRIGSRRLAVWVVAGLLFIAAIDMWALAMQTLAIVVAATVLSVAIGIPTGIWCARRDAVFAVVRPFLDLMQTMPSFVYLVPAMLLFGLGKVPALVATMTYAVPPVIRLTNLGIRQVARETVEAGHAFGANPRQLLMKVQLPLAFPTIMAGINQTIMMALAMVVIASFVGAGGLGQEVLHGLSRLDVGQAFAGGVSITILAIIIDRMSAQASRPKRERLAEQASPLDELGDLLRAPEAPGAPAAAPAMHVATDGGGVDGR